jgi:tRNA threonylcarbamoyladenosine biosynthesis protein TsaE
LILDSSDAMSVHLSLPDEAATLRLGGALAETLGADGLRGHVLHLIGDLGAGKTTLVRGFLRALGHAGRVRSPTYTLVEPYSLSRLNLYHFDFYRFKDQTEWLSSGFREHFNPDTFCVVEWPERAGTLLSPPDLAVTLQYQLSGREARLAAPTKAGAAWLASASQRFSSTS